MKKMMPEIAADLALKYKAETGDNNPGGLPKEIQVADFETIRVERGEAFAYDVAEEVKLHLAEIAEEMMESAVTAYLKSRDVVADEIEAIVVAFHNAANPFDILADVAGTAWAEVEILRGNTTRVQQHECIEQEEIEVERTKVLLALLAFNAEGLDTMAHKQVIEALDLGGEKRVTLALKLIYVLATNEKCVTDFEPHSSQDDFDRAAKIIEAYEEKHGEIQAS